MQSVEERQLAAILAVVAPERAALMDLELSDDALDDEAARAAVDALRAIAAPRDGRPAGLMLRAIASSIECRWFERST